MCNPNGTIWILYLFVLRGLNLSFLLWKNENILEGSGTIQQFWEPPELGWKNPYWHWCAGPVVLADFEILIYLNLTDP